jgi:hypothetical protein
MNIMNIKYSKKKPIILLFYKNDLKCIKNDITMNNNFLHTPLHNNV